MSTKSEIHISEHQDRADAIIAVGGLMEQYDRVPVEKTKTGRGYLVVAYDGEAVRWRDIYFAFAMTGGSISRDKLLASGHFEQISEGEPAAYYRPKAKAA